MTDRRKRHLERAAQSIRAARGEIKGLPDKQVGDYVVLLALGIIEELYLTRDTSDEE